MCALVSCSALHLFIIVPQRLSELNLVSGVVVHTELPISPRLAYDPLRDASTAFLKFSMKQIEIFGEDVNSNR